MAESTPDELCFLTALELCARYRDRSLSPVEVTEAILRRIERLNPRLVAFITVTAELALEQAQAAEQAYAPGGRPEMLAGIPISIKDLTPTRGIRTTRGSLLYEHWEPDEDAPFVERCYAAGAVMLGKTNTPEFGWKADTTNRIVGSTHNPWMYGKTAGGSSGGGAAAVAAGMDRSPREATAAARFASRRHGAGCSASSRLAISFPSRRTTTRGRGCRSTAP